MSDITPIQWCHTTVNPVMGCHGCELWPNIGKVKSTLLAAVRSDPDFETRKADTAIKSAMEHYQHATQIWHDRLSLALKLESLVPSCPAYIWLERIERLYSCYAGKQHVIRGGKPWDWSTPSNRGYAAVFDQPELFPGRVAKVAKLRDLRGRRTVGAPWLDSLPRLIFVSDMGDALTKSVGFYYLKKEIIDNVSSLNGRRHIWLWLTKRPQRMAEFGRWLEAEHGQWPDNLVAMTTVTSRATLNRVAALEKVPAKIRGLSVEPLLEDVSLDLRAIDWVIAGGESGSYARPFDLSWAYSLREQCQKAGAAFFMKQLGANITDNGFPLTVRDAHGGDWEEWPSDLKIRDFPGAFRDDSLVSADPIN